MVDSTTPAPACTRSAAPDRHGPKGPVPPALCPFGPRRPASAARAHAGTAAAESTISRSGPQRAAQRVVRGLIRVALDEPPPPASGERLGGAVPADVDAAVHARPGDLAAQRDLLDGVELARERALAAAPSARRHAVEPLLQRGQRVVQRAEALALGRAALAHRQPVGHPDSVYAVRSPAWRRPRRPRGPRSRSSDPRGARRAAAPAGSPAGSTR